MNLFCVVCGACGCCVVSQPRACHVVGRANMVRIQLRIYRQMCNVNHIDRVQRLRSPQVFLHDSVRHVTLIDGDSETAGEKCPFPFGDLVQQRPQNPTFVDGSPALFSEFAQHAPNCVGVTVMEQYRMRTEIGIWCFGWDR